MLRHQERSGAGALSAVVAAPLGPRGGPNPLLLGALK